jgi:hypothetical protein
VASRLLTPTPEQVRELLARRGQKELPGSADPCPRPAVQGVLERGSIHAPLAGQSGDVAPLQQPVCSQLANVTDPTLSKPAVSNPLSTAESAVGDLVALVDRRRPPAEVIDPVVCRIAIREVARLHTSWLRPDERQQNKAVDVTRHGFTAFCADVHEAVTRSSPSGSEFLPASARSKLARKSAPYGSIAPNTVHGKSEKSELTITDARVRIVAERRPDLSLSAHRRLPLQQLPEKEKRAGGRETAFRVIGPSPRRFSDSGASVQGVAV